MDVKAGAGPAAFQGQGCTEELGVESEAPSLARGSGGPELRDTCLRHSPASFPHGRLCCWIEGLVTGEISLDQSLQSGKWGFIPTRFRFTKTLRGDPGEVQAECEEAPVPVGGRTFSGRPGTGEAAACG